MMDSASGAPLPNAPLAERIQALLESLSAYIEQYHGGAVRFIALEGSVLKVRLEGACLGCPLSENTLHGWVEGTVRQFFPEVQRVESVEAPPTPPAEKAA
jgi:Fe-S cluster biogenesis protein NfuA